MAANNDHQYVTFCLDNTHEGIPLDHEEIYEPINEHAVHQALSEVSDENVNQDIIETKIALKISSTSSEEETFSFVYPIYVKKDTLKQFTTGDESMAVEALRQLGGMYPNMEDKKLSCWYCAKMFTESELIKHQLICRSKKHICEICNRIFQNKIELNDHMICHEIERPHACRTCGHIFYSKANLETHMIKFHHQIKQVHKCKVCGTNFCRPSSLSNHMKIHSYVAGRALIQTQSNVAVQTIENIKNVSNIQEPILTTTQSLQNIEIPQAEWMMQTYNFTNDRNNIDNLISSSAKIDTLQEDADLPDEEFSQIEYILQSSVNLELNQQQNLNVHNSEATVKVLSLKSQIESNSYSCNTCKISFVSQTSLTEHEKVHVKNNLIIPIECKYCGEQFQDCSFLKMHQISCVRKISHNSRKKVQINFSNTKWGKHACPKCGKKFTTKQKMFRHQWIHRKKTYFCEVCNSQFEKQLELHEHRLLVHSTESPFTCNECGKSFVSRQGLWEHGRTHAGSPSHFLCNICSKTFSSRQGYLIHHRTHTGERPYGCKFCWKAFRDGGTLRKHERIHTGERPHVCPLCARAFNQKVVLREHVRWVHAAKNESTSSGSLFLCPLCENSTQDRDELCAHIVKHSDLITAEAKAKTKGLMVKTKVKKKKNYNKQTKFKQLNIIKEQVVDLAKEDEQVFSVLEHNDSTKIENAYLVLKHELNNTLSIQACSNKIFSTDNSQKSVSKFTIPNALDSQSQEKTVILQQDSTLNTIHLNSIPKCNETAHQNFVSSSGVNTLSLISKHNEKLPVLTIPNSQTIINFSNGLSNIGVSLSSKTSIGEPISFTEESILNRYEEFAFEDETENGTKDLVCGICEKEFSTKNILMAHVKIHI